MKRGYNKFRFIGPYLIPNDRMPTIWDIQQRVAKYYGIRLQDMVSHRRPREIAHPRQVAMYLSERLTPHSLPAIGRRFGGRDHTTVIHAMKAVQKRREADESLDRDIDALTNGLMG